MGKLNVERLKYISNSMQEVIIDLDEIVSIYDNQPTIIKKHLEKSFRTSFLQYKELLGNYMSQCLNVISISVSRITYSDSIELCIEKEFLPKEDLVLYRTLSKFRNDTAHMYKRPPFKVLLDFYKDNRKFLEEIINNINNIIKEQKY